MCNIAKNSLIFYVLIPMLWLKFLVILRSLVDTKENDFPHEYRRKLDSEKAWEYLPAQWEEQFCVQSQTSIRGSLLRQLLAWRDLRGFLSKTSSQWGLLPYLSGHKFSTVNSLSGEVSKSGASSSRESLGDNAALPEEHISLD